MGHILYNQSFRKQIITVALLLLLACDSGSASIAQSPTNTKARGSNGSPSTGGNLGRLRLWAGARKHLAELLGRATLAGQAVEDRQAWPGPVEWAVAYQ